MGLRNPEDPGVNPEPSAWVARLLPLIRATRRVLGPLLPAIARALAPKAPCSTKILLGATEQKIGIGRMPEALGFGFDTEIREE